MQWRSAPLVQDRRKELCILRIYLTSGTCKHNGESSDVVEPMISDYLPQKSPFGKTSLGVYQD
jgi:hypothetical protein